MKKINLILLLLIFFSNLQAQDFWLQPDKYIYERTEDINIRFYTGHNYEGDNWTGNSQAIASAWFYYADVQDNFTNEIGSEKGDSMQLAVTDECTAMMTVTANTMQVNYNGSVDSSGIKKELNFPVAYKIKYHEMDSADLVTYQFSAKTIFQVGPKYTSTPKKHSSLVLDIIPLANPYGMKEGDPITIKILFKKEPLRHSFITIWHRVNNHSTRLFLLTNSKGEICFDLKPEGYWMILCAKNVKAVNNTDTHPINDTWMSYYSSCTWGYE